MQLRREGDGAPQALVYFPEPLFLQCRARSVEDGDQVEVAAARLVVTCGE
ncbi:hypothetical protein [Streptomyces colonosanans]